MDIVYIRDLRIETIIEFMIGSERSNRRLV